MIFYNSDLKNRILSRKTLKFLKSKGFHEKHIVEFSESKSSNSVYIYLIKDDVLYECRRSDHRTTWTNLLIDIRVLPSGLPITEGVYIKTRFDHVGKVVSSDKYMTRLMWASNSITSIPTYYLNKLQNVKG